MSDRLLVASRKGLFRFRFSGGEWRAGAPAFPGEPVSALLADPRDGRLYAALRLGHFGVKLHRSEDGGETWTELAAPALPAGTGGATDLPGIDMIWTLVPGGADAKGVLWCGTLPGALFRSGDGGETWSLVESLWNMPERANWSGGGYDHPGIHTILVDPRDAARLTVAVSTGGIWKSTDAGASWRLAGRGLRAEYVPPALANDPASQDVHRLASCRAAPDIVWCQHHNGIFLSIDGAETFAEIAPVAPSAFGFAVAAHPADPATAWFVPAVKDECRIPVDGRLVVNRTSDGGRSFQALRTGLPGGASYDLIYRHALDVDGTGARIAMGSTTGNLWVGMDGGERWTLVSAHLPPIAQVAFG
ncbi:MAG: exo-alpha-sialidase [Alphaproteobacteria bacterium]|nr:exo-alpha-sialidase [Alphaproteobacteria bacterium]